MSAQHTPGPWTHHRDGLPELGNQCEVIEGADGTLIVYMAMRRPADAERIVQCVNAHDDLLAAARMVKAARVGYREWDLDAFDAAVDAAEAAIAKATGSPAC